MRSGAPCISPPGRSGAPSFAPKFREDAEMPCRVLLADDHQIVRQGLRALLEKAGHNVVGEAADGREACELAQKLQPNIAVLDLAMPLLNGLDAIGEIRRVSPNTVAIEFVLLQGSELRV